ncbi:hypothetical protein [Actinokineospora sp.]|uniref:hypothetical protein n=1 Tax=Actinokineospora sp. TaxID=1872133 RepID=UPI003D6A6151
MSDFFMLEPEVPGELGDGTEQDRNTHPPTVTRVEYAFHNWLGDDLITAFPCFLVTEWLAAKLSDADMSGFEIRPASVTLAEEGEDWIGDVDKLPAFKWLFVTGKPGHDDFGVTDRADLVVSRHALDALGSGTLSHCDIAPYASV